MSQLSAITKITTQKRNKSRYNIFIDHQYAFSVDEDVLVQYNLHKGMEIDDREVIDVLGADSLNQSYLLAINYLSYRMRSIKEVNDYLIKKEVDPAHVERIIVRLLNEGLLNDEQFANAFITDRINLTSKGPGLIKRELIEKGIKVDIIDAGLKVFSFDSQLEKAVKWAERSLKRRSRDSYRKRVERLRTALIRQGFANDVITEVLTVVQVHVEDGSEWEALVHQADKLYRRQCRRYSGYELMNRLKAGLFSRGFPGELIQRYIEELEVEEETK